MRFFWSSIRRGSTLSVLDQLVVSGASLLTGVVVGRSCPQEVFGLYVLGLSIVTFGSDLQSSLIGTPYAVNSPRLKGRDLAEYTGSVLVHQAISSAFVTLLLGGAWIAQQFGLGPRGLAPVMLTLSVISCFILLRDFLRRLCFARLLIHTALILDALVAILQVGGVLTLAYFGLLSAAGAFWVIGIACLTTGLAALALGRGYYLIVPKRTIADFRVGWSLGRWVLASSLLWGLGMNLYPWLVATFHGAAATGIWGVCVSVVSVATPALGGVQNYLGPRIATLFARSGPEALRTFIGRTITKLLAVLFCCWLILLLAGERIAVLIYDGRYSGTGSVITLLGLSLIAGTVGTIYSRVLFAIERADIDFRVNIVTVLVLLLAGVPMVRAWGPRGAALALLLSNAFAAGIRWFLAIRLLGRIVDQRCVLHPTVRVRTGR